jgi:hypothetical protein
VVSAAAAAPIASIIPEAMITFAIAPSSVVLLMPALRRGRVLPRIAALLLSDCGDGDENGGLVAAFFEGGALSGRCDAPLTSSERHGRIVESSTR